MVATVTDPLLADTEVLVVGAGPVGLATAALLAGAGVDVTVVEAGRGPVNESRATDLHAGTMQALRRSGLTDLLLPLGRPTRRITFWSPTGRLGDYRTDTISSAYPYILTVPQCATEGALGAHLAVLGGTVQHSTRIERLSWHDGGVTAEASGGRTIRARWLIGCDGFSSQVRSAMGIAYRGKTYSNAYSLADLRADCPLDADELHMILDPAGLLAVLPMHLEGWRRVLVQLPPGHRLPNADPLPELLRHAAQRGVPLQVNEARWQSTFRIHRRLATTFRRGPVLLAGDAAHACSPIGGQGLNLGLRDAVTLSGTLTAVLRGRAPERALDEWAERRRARARRVLAWTDLATRSTSVRGGPPRLLRDAVIAATLGVPTGQRLLAGVIAGL